MIAQLIGLGNAAIISGSVSGPKMRYMSKNITISGAEPKFYFPHQLDINVKECNNRSN
jgi:hypothetical protein